MSDTGLYSGLYSRVRSMAELVDQVILDLKSTEHGAAPNACRTRLATLLASLGDNESSDLMANILQVILRDAPRCNLNATALGTELLHIGDKQDTIKKLELLATVLEAERSSMHSKMRGL